MTQYTRITAADLLTPGELAIVRERSDEMALFLVAHAWGVIAAAIALVAWLPNPVTYLLAVMVIGSRQLGLAILMHDGAHGVLAKTPWLNHLLSQWFCAFPVFTETYAYRAYHLTHHARTQQDDDPDLELSAPFPISRDSFRRKIIRDITGQTGFKQRRAQFRAALGKPDWPLERRIETFGKKLGRPLLVNAIILGVMIQAGVWWAYPLLWIVPLLTWHQVVTRVRNIAEHAVVPDNNDPFRNARTTTANWLERAFLAPYWVNYHVEHHLLMWVPCYRLPLLHKILLAKGFGPRMELRTGYLDVLRLATSGSGDGNGKHRVRQSGEGTVRAGVSTA
ncbi:MAG: fatty acid desaturase [Alphaproteobacteria bacterium]|nr:fatty acid desaturase [Alphaproteobacteria bacterium]